MKNKAIKIRDHNKIKISLILIIGLIIFLSACSSDKNMLSDQSIKLYRQPAGIELDTKNGFYHRDNNNFLYFFDYATKQDVIVCAKPNCRHEQWNENTPVEDRCLAYSPGDYSGFVLDDKLYLIHTDFDGKKNISTIYQSNLDRTEIKSLAQFTSGHSPSFIVASKTLYLAVTMPQFTEMKDGSSEQSSQNICNVIRVDLTTGKFDKLFSDKVDNNNSLEILAADIDIIYFRYSYFINSFNGVNFKEAQPQVEYWQYDISTNKLKPAFTNFSEIAAISDALIKDNIMVACLSPIIPEPTSTVELKKINLTDGSTESLISCNNAFLLGNSFFCQQDNIPGFIEITAEGKKLEYKDMKLDNIYPLAIAGDYVYLSVQEPNQPSSHGFILKDDLLSGKSETIITSH